jgi:hypothetical protein
MPSPEQFELMQQLGRRPEFAEMLQSMVDDETKVLESNAQMENLFRAQGAIRVLKLLQSYAKPRK